MDIEKRPEIVAYLADRKYLDCYNESQKRAHRRTMKYFVLKNGRTLYHFQDLGENSTPKSMERRIEEAQLVVVGNVEKQNICSSMHGNLGDGHFGINKTCEKIGERFVIS